MNFKFGESLEPSTEDGLVYLRDEYSINYTGQKTMSAGGVLINDLTLEVDFTGRVLYLSGLCSHSLWQARPLSLPRHGFRQLLIDVGSELQTGVYRSINEGNPWPVFADSRSELLCIGDPDAPGEANCFVSGGVMVLDKTAPAALWLFGLKNMPKELGLGGRDLRPAGA